MNDLARQKIIVALDVATENEALDLVIQLKDHVGLFKIGLELLNSVGVGIVKRIIELGGDVFYDGKFMDIPNTVAGASKAVSGLAVKMFNVHTMGGTEMMKAAVKACEDQASQLHVHRPLVLGVTILTSIDATTMNQQLRIPGEIVNQVTHLARLAEQSGLDGVIASPQEIEAIKNNMPRPMIIVTPGVRPTWANPGDQKRIMTPSEAISRGASYLVIGRPITKPPAEIGTPIEAAKLISEEISLSL